MEQENRLDIQKQEYERIKQKVQLYIDRINAIKSNPENLTPEIKANVTVSFCKEIYGDKLNEGILLTVLPLYEDMLFDMNQVQFDDEHKIINLFRKIDESQLGMMQSSIKVYSDDIVVNCMNKDLLGSYALEFSQSSNTLSNNVFDTGTDDKENGIYIVYDDNGLVISKTQWEKNAGIGRSIVNGSLFTEQQMLKYNILDDISESHYSHNKLIIGTIEQNITLKPIIRGTERIQNISGFSHDFSVSKSRFLLEDHYYNSYLHNFVYLGDRDSYYKDSIKKYINLLPNLKSKFDERIETINKKFSNDIEIEKNHKHI